MKRLILVSAMILGLAATGALASQNKNAKPPSKSAASSNTGGTMSGGKSTGRHHRRHHRRHHHKGTASTGNMSATPKTPKTTKNKNSK
jgi:hypothetical protein